MNVDRLGADSNAMNSPFWKRSGSGELAVELKSDRKHLERGAWPGHRVALQQSMIHSGTYPAFGQPAGRSAGRLRAGLLSALLPLLAPALVLAQSAQLQLSDQKFEQAVEGDDFPAAEAYGRSALVAAEGNPGADPHELTDLLLRLGEVSAKAGDDQQAVQFYRRALAMQESALGSEHPDLVPVLTALANIQAKDRHYADAEALLQRVLSIERAAYGERHENVLATLQQLRDVYRAAADTDALARTDRQIRVFGATSKDWRLHQRAAARCCRRITATG